MAITNSARMPEVLTTYTNPNSIAPGVRLQPIEGVRLIVEDHIGFSGGSTALSPVTPVLFNNNSVVNYGLGDVKLYISQDVGQELTNVYTYNPYTGERQNQVGQVPFDLQDIAFRDNGQLRAFDRAIESQATGDRDVLVDYVNIDPGTAATTSTAAGLQTFHIEFSNATPPVPAAVASDDGTNPEAFTFGVVGGQERGYVVTKRPTPAGSSSPFYSPVTNVLANVGLSRPGPSYFSNILFEFDENSGAAISSPFQDKTGVPTGLGAGTVIVDRGYLE